MIIRMYLLCLLAKQHLSEKTEIFRFHVLQGSAVIYLTLVEACCRMWSLHWRSEIVSIYKSLS